MGITDLCLSTEAAYTRHPSQSDWHSPFQSHPLALEYFPSGAIVTPPEIMTNDMRHLIEKQRNILDFTLSSLLRRKGKNLALIVVYTLVVFALGSVMFFTQAMKKEAALILKETPEIIVQRLVAGRHDLIPLDYAQKISQIRGVEAVKGRLWGYYFDPVARANYTLMVPEDSADRGNYISVGEGVLRAAQTSRGEVLSLKDYDR